MVSVRIAGNVGRGADDDVKFLIDEVDLVDLNFPRTNIKALLPPTTDISCRKDV